MTTIEHPSRRRELPVLLTVLGVAALAVAVPLGPRGILAGAAVMAAFLGVALLEVRSPVITWPNAIGALVAIVWLIPIKGYALPVDLPFNVEHYRLAILVLTLALAVGLLTRTQRLSLGGRGLPVALLAGGATVALLTHSSEIDTSSLEPSAGVKALSYFLSFFIVFVLVSSVIRTQAAIDTVVRALVIGGTIVAFAAIYEARTRYNVFDHLHQWLPGFERQLRDVSLERAGRFRVYASAQHPIALATALTIVVPMGVYLATRARTAMRARLWLATVCVLAAAVAATISRTAFVMVIVMAAAAFALRGRQLLRYWPVLLALPVLIHFVAPGALGGIYKAFFPQEGLVSSLEGRAGEGGSGRFADVGPGFSLWSEEPIFGHGLGMAFPATDTSMSPGQDPPDLIFDDQYLDTLVKLGVVGVIGSFLFFWGGAIALLRGARQTTGPPSDFLAACAVAAFGFATSMFFFDAYAFVQATLVAILIIALGLRCLSIEQTAPSTATSKGETT